MKCPVFCVLDVDVLEVVDVLVVELELEPELVDELESVDEVVEVEDAVLLLQRVYSGGDDEGGAV